MNNSFEHELHAINCEPEQIDSTVNMSCVAGERRKEKEILCVCVFVCVFLCVCVDVYLHVDVSTCTL